jgi:hypothetical protein
MILQFDEKPDYSYLKDLFLKLMIKNQYIQDFKYDWTTNQMSNVFIRY